MYRHLMVPLDDSPLSVDSVCKAVELARTLDEEFRQLFARILNLAPDMVVGAGRGG